MSDAVRISKVIDDVLAVVDAERQRVPGMIYDKTTPILARMRNLDVSHLLRTEDEGFVFGLTDTTPDVIWPVNVGLAMQTDDGDWNFVSAKTVTGRDVRGKVRIVAPKMIQAETVTMMQDGRIFAAVEHMSWISKKWVDATYKATTRHHDSVRNMPAAEVDHFAGKGHMLMAAALRFRYEWSVSIGREDSPSFRFSTDATGIHALLKERDKGKDGRREALKSWVTDHWRQSRHDPDEEIYVRKHLRGGEAFMWRGYRCEWQPSQFDRERNEAFKAEREVMGRQAVRPNPSARS